MSLNKLEPAVNLTLWFSASDGGGARIPISAAMHQRCQLHRASDDQWRKAMATSFLLEATERADGKVRFVCDVLPGFRLLLSKRESQDSYGDEIKAALTIFMPYHMAAEARGRCIEVRPAEDKPGDRTGRDFNMVASLAAC